MPQALKKQIIQISSFLLFAVLLFVLLPVNAFAQSSETTVRIDVEQVFTNNSNDLSPDSMFSYSMTPRNNGNPMPENTDTDGVFRFTITGSDTKSVGPITYTRAGEYEYTVRQVVPSPPVAGYVYDTQVYTVRVIIQYSSSGLSPKIVLMMNESGKKVSSIVFRNGYDMTFPHVTDDPPVRKVLHGNPPKTPEFTFVLTADDPAYPMPDGSVSGQKECTVAGAGSVEFGEIVFDRTGTFTYKVMEKNTGLSGFTYDSTVYTLTYVITVENDKLAVARTITSGNNSQAVEEAVFTNRYGSTPPSPGPDDPDPPNKPDSPTPHKPDSPKTGDGSHLLLWIVLMVLSLMGMLYVFHADRNKRRAAAVGSEKTDTISDFSENTAQSSTSGKEEDR